MKEHNASPQNMTVNVFTVLTILHGFQTLNKLELLHNSEEELPPQACPNCVIYSRLPCQTLQILHGNVSSLDVKILCFFSVQLILIVLMQWRRWHMFGKSLKFLYSLKNLWIWGIWFRKLAIWSVKVKT